jgi:ATP-dependent RNA helicase DDX23/PRP28
VIAATGFWSVLCASALSRSDIANDHRCNVSAGDRRHKAALSVEQRVEWCHNEGQKRTRLLQILQKESPPFIVFANLRNTCTQIGKYLGDAGLSYTVLHGQMSQDLRMAALESFKNQEVDILVATDVAGRGIDVKGVAQVINYEMPHEIERYTHRIGRTGRAGQKGIATSLVTEEDSSVFYDLSEMLKGAGQPVPKEIERHEASKFAPIRKGGGAGAAGPNIE